MRVRLGISNGLRMPATSRV
ncbi:hypothetical protein MTR67_002685 [Solanum verrucosum]|uniref:Uncharacterized protein n=1 Tax=Solanum verrucosum TaxID=315347 RepID=A0AAF0PU38_SOLVR|nr:hypothetical protein MTR67_002685 [Solanum verrucosum]